VIVKFPHISPRPTEAQLDDWETLHTGTQEDVMTVALHQLAESTRLRDQRNFFVILTSMGWTIAIAFIVWWLFLGGEQSCR